MIVGFYKSLYEGRGCLKNLLRECWTEIALPVSVVVSVLEQQHRCHRALAAREVCYFLLNAVFINSEVLLREIRIEPA